MSVQNLKFVYSVALPVPEIIGAQQNLGSPWIRQRSLFSKIFNGFLFGWTCECILAKFEVRSFSALPVPEIIGDTQKIWAVPRSFSPKFLMSFCSDGTCECRLPAKFEVRSSTIS